MHSSTFLLSSLSFLLHADCCVFLTSYHISWLFNDITLFLQVTYTVNYFISCVTRPQTLALRWHTILQILTRPSTGCIFILRDSFFPSLSFFFSFLSPPPLPSSLSLESFVSSCKWMKSMKDPLNRLNISFSSQSYVVYPHLTQLTVFLCNWWTRVYRVKWKWKSFFQSFFSLCFVSPALYFSLLLLLLFSSKACYFLAQSFTMFFHMHLAHCLHSLLLLHSSSSSLPLPPPPPLLLSSVYVLAFSQISFFLSLTLLLFIFYLSSSFLLSCRSQQENIFPLRVTMIADVKMLSSVTLSVEWKRERRDNN